ncbi:hypothetical protein BC830DRAFT_1084057 [Chytriomyces sp. MP71]|nr:hypothetical protein BC830DRAFT_1084057 [Chytriomyces sp. MP71]
MLAHINAVQSQLETLSQRMESNARAKSLPKASRHKLSPGEELIAQLRAFAHVGGTKRGINTHIGIPSKPPTWASPEQKHGQMDGIGGGGAISYDLFHTKPLQDAAGSPAVELTVLDFRVTALEASIGSSLMSILPPAPKWRIASTSLKPRLVSTSTSSSPLLPPSMPQKTFTHFSFKPYNKTYLQRLLHILQTTEKDPPDIDPIQFSMQHFLTLRADLRATNTNHHNTLSPHAPKTVPPTSNPASLRIAKLHETLGPLYRAVQGLSALLARLETLAPLHTHAAQTSDAVAGVRGAHAHSREGMEGVLAVLEEVGAGFAANVDLCRRNWEALEGRVKGLQARLDTVSYLAEK